MANFKKFKIAVEAQLQIMMQRGSLFRVDVTGDELWDTYLKSFPEGSNPVYRERTEHDCSCCKKFIQNIGNVVVIHDADVLTVWDVDVGGDYQVVADALAAQVRAQEVADFYLHYEPNIGTDYNHQMVDGVSKRWDHFHFKLPAKFVKPKDQIGTCLSELRSGKDVFKRGLAELTQEAIDTVLELISQGSLYRGDEHKSAVLFFSRHKTAYDKQKTLAGKDLYAWAHAEDAGAVARIRNTAIGTLLVNLSEGVDVETAVRKFESVVAPHNYKRPTALITKDMIAKAQAKVEELGLTGALSRRFAVAEDLTINNVIFADRSVKPAMNVFEELAATATVKPKSFDKVEEISIGDFIKDVVPLAKTIEVLFENKHAGNLVSLVAPCDPEAGNLFKWDNNFSWAYEGDVTDSVKERVKRAGGRVEGDLRCSLSWFNYDDLDLRMVEPGGNTIYYRNKVSIKSRGSLDVDMNAGSGQSREAVENIIYPARKTMPEGEYYLQVNNYCQRELIDIGFEIEIEFDGVTHCMQYPKALKTGETTTVAIIEYRKDTGFQIKDSLPQTQGAGKTLYGIQTGTFHKVTMLMNSPNFWDGQAIGNKHWFFIMEGCKNEGQVRGFYNEFLKPELEPHRKVFEVLGGKMKVEESDRQLSGIGFSSTQRNQLVVKVSGSLSRVLKVNF